MIAEPIRRRPRPNLSPRFFDRINPDVYTIHLEPTPRIRDNPKGGNAGLQTLSLTLKVPGLTGGVTLILRQLNSTYFLIGTISG